MAIQRQSNYHNPLTHRLLRAILIACLAGFTFSAFTLHRGATVDTPVLHKLAQPDCVPTLRPLEPASIIYQPVRYQPITGQVEEEFEFSCMAQGTEYRTVINLSRPAEPGKFSGVIIVEPTHPSNIWPIRATTAVYLGSAGHGSIVVNSSSDSVERLVKPANPGRYGTLSVPTTDDLEQEILQQLGLALKQGALEFAPAPTLILGGYSNTGGRVRDYIDYFHGRYDYVYDGYLVAQTAVGTLPGPIPELTVPVIELQGERELIATMARNPAGLAYRRADTDNFRLYEVPGMAHLDTSDPSRWSFPPANCGIDSPSTFPLSHVWDATLALLVNWVTLGHPAPRAPWIATNTDGTIIRDTHGNATGGMPVLQIKIPVANIQTVSPAGPGNTSSRCDMIGPQYNFSAEKLRGLYASAVNYESMVTDELDDLIEAGWTLELHRDELLGVAREQAVAFGK